MHFCYLMILILIGGFGCGVGQGRKIDFTAPPASTILGQERPTVSLGAVEATASHVRLSAGALQADSESNYSSHSLKAQASVQMSQSVSE